MSKSILTPVFRVAFPNVFRPKKNDLNGKEEYSIVALFEKGIDLSILKAAIKEACEKKWGTDQKKWPANLRTPLRNQGERAKEGVLPQGYEDGAFYLNLKSTQKPGVVDQNVQDIIDESQFYAGCYARATIRAFAYDNKGNRGVSFGLGNIQKVKDGDALGGRVPAQRDFAPIEGAEKNSASDLF